MQEIPRLKLLGICSWLNKITKRIKVGKILQSLKTTGQWKTCSINIAYFDLHNLVKHRLKNSRSIVSIFIPFLQHFTEFIFWCSDFVPLVYNICDSHLVPWIYIYIYIYFAALLYNYFILDEYVHFGLLPYQVGVIKYFRLVPLNEMYSFYSNAPHRFLCNWSSFFDLWDLCS